MPSMTKLAVKRSACDQCRAKRIRCLRAKDSTAPCARCSHVGARCVTSASGQPGRPPKRLYDNGYSSPKDIAGYSGDATASKPAMTPESPGDLITPESHPDFSALLNPPSVDKSPVLGQGALSIMDQLNSPSQLQGLFNVENELNELLYMGAESSTAFDMDIGPPLDHGEYILPPTPSSICFPSVASSFTRFREKINQRIAAVDIYYSDSSEVLQRCKGGDESHHDMENPAATLLVCTKELTDIIQSLNPAVQLRTQIEDEPSTETVLLALSSYLALMRLFDTIFHHMYKHLCQAPPELCESIKVRSVLRIGGVSSLQDMPLKVYAMGILDAIQSQVKTLERCMGIPAEYCLSEQKSASATASGIFSRPDRVQLFWAVMAQEDVQSRLGGSKSYAESIRTSIKDSMAFIEK